MKSAVLPLVLALLVGLAAPAEAGGHGHGRGGHGHGGGHGFGGHEFHHHRFFGGPVFVGPGLWWDPFWYPYPYYPYAPPVVIQPEPQAYVQQPQASTYWYYCADARAYYPYVQQCPGGWLTVIPTPKQ